MGLIEGVVCVALGWVASAVTTDGRRDLGLGSARGLNRPMRGFSWANGTVCPQNLDTKRVSFTRSSSI